MIKAKEIDGELWIKASDHHHAIKEALAQTQEPVAIEYWFQETMESGRWVTTGNMSMATAKRILSDEDYCEVYPQSRIVGTSPPQLTWVGLTDEDRLRLWLKTEAEDVDRYAFAKAVEAALKELNT